MKPTRINRAKLAAQAGPWLGGAKPGVRLELPADLEVLAFIGLWCGDTHDQLPEMLALLDASGLPEARLQLFTYGREKPWESEYKIERLPTFVFLRGGREVGRIVERPRVSLVEDLCAVLYKENL